MEDSPANRIRVLALIAPLMKLTGADPDKLSLEPAKTMMGVKPSYRVMLDGKFYGFVHMDLEDKT